MANRTNYTNSNSYYGYEYYMDYVDLPQVDERKLKANKWHHFWLSVAQLHPLLDSINLTLKCPLFLPTDSIVIAFWVSLAAFVVLLFLILLYMSWSGSVPIRGARTHCKCTWNYIFNLLFFVQKAGSFQISPTSTSQPQGQIQEQEEGNEQPQGNNCPPDSVLVTAPDNTPPVQGNAHY